MHQGELSLPARSPGGWAGGGRPNPNILLRVGALFAGSLTSFPSILEEEKGLATTTKAASSLFATSRDTSAAQRRGERKMTHGSVEGGGRGEPSLAEELQQEVLPPGRLNLTFPPPSEK
jgi:hypothetical protein